MNKMKKYGLKVISNTAPPSNENADPVVAYFMNCQRQYEKDFATVLSILETQNAAIIEMQEAQKKFMDQFSPMHTALRAVSEADGSILPTIFNAGRQ